MTNQSQSSTFKGNIFLTKIFANAPLNRLNQTRCDVRVPMVPCSYILAYCYLQNFWYLFIETLYMTIIGEVKIFLKSQLMHFKCLYSLPLEKSVELIWTNLNPFTHENFVPKVEICTMVLKKKMWKVYRQTNRQTTGNRRLEKLTWTLNSGELKWPI